MTEQPSSRDRFLAALRGNPDGSLGQRVRYYASRIVAGGVAGFMIVAMATSPRGGEHNSFDLSIYLAAIAAGGVLALLIVTIPRLLHPKDWPTADEFRRGRESRGNAPHRNDGEQT